VNDCTGNGIARYRKWDRAQFGCGTLITTVPELEEPNTGNGTTRIESRSDTGLNDSPAPEMVRNESRPVPVMAESQFGTEPKISRSGPPKRTVLEMGAITGNGSAVSSTSELLVWVLTHTHH